MHSHTLESWRRRHDFNTDTSLAEHHTLGVVLLTAAMMVIEIVAGMYYGSMALLADGWHMATHVAAFGITLCAYRYARTHASDPRFSFGTGKVTTLGGFASAVALAVVAGVMAVESTLRLFDPRAIHFDEALAVAVLGLIVNLVSGYLLGVRAHGHQPDEGPGAQASEVHDHNLRAAYLHVLADALTSVLAIAALLAGKYAGLHMLDPVIGLIGAAVIGRWALGLMRTTSNILLDGAADAQTSARIVAAIENDADNRVADLHVWQVGGGQFAVEIVLVTHDPRPPAHYKGLIAGIPRLAHVVVEVDACPDATDSG
ncbi:MAG: CDF family Co(II)/Ni(II) efflux transporter DmeF [Gammaproteobacteria bacterium]